MNVYVILSIAVIIWLPYCLMFLILPLIFALKALLFSLEKIYNYLTFILNNNKYLKFASICSYILLGIMAIMRFL